MQNCSKGKITKQNLKTHLKLFLQDINVATLKFMRRNVNVCCRFVNPICTLMYVTRKVDSSIKGTVIYSISYNGNTTPYLVCLGMGNDMKNATTLRSDSCITACFQTL